uniref:Chemokine interleukin-8-like domain-containing protein n=1 Tax=Eptatretus burgeri TaxID=7764 RepID=A0A8C4QZG3_EPTBU
MDNRTVTLLCLSLLPSSRCRCIKTQSHPRIRHLVTKVKIIAPSHRCGKLEIIAALKDPHPNEVCLNTNAPWVKRFINRRLAKGESTLHFIVNSDTFTKKKVY